MNNKMIAPVLVGRGMAGQAILKSLAIVSQTDPELTLLPVRIAARGTPLKSYLSEQADTVLFLANPSGLHARSIVEGDRAGYSMIVADKPVCVRPEELSLLWNVNLPVRVLHGYRVLWGTRTIRRMIEAGELGEIFCFESRYWQSSAAQMAVTGDSEKRAWKNDPELNGPFDVLTDLGSHVVDTCLYLMSDQPVESVCWISHWNAAAPHRDTHVHLCLKFPGSRRAFASVSKIVHGAANNFEYTVIGSRGSATWRFMQPDEVECGSGGRTTILRREAANASSGTLPFHGLGWLEGYVEIVHQALREASGLPSIPVPTLQESLAVMNVLLHSENLADAPSP